MIPTPPATKLTRRQRIAHAAIAGLQREVEAIRRRILIGAVMVEARQLLEDMERSKGVRHG